MELSRGEPFIAPSSDPLPGGNLGNNSKAAGPTRKPHSAGDYIKRPPENAAFSRVAKTRNPKRHRDNRDDRNDRDRGLSVDRPKHRGRKKVLDDGVNQTLVRYVINVRDTSTGDGGNNWESYYPVADMRGGRCVDRFPLGDFRPTI